MEDQCGGEFPGGGAGRLVEEEKHMVNKDRVPADEKLITSLWQTGTNLVFREFGFCFSLVR